MDNPFALLRRRLDPCADLRVHSMLSASMTIGPVAGDDLHLSRGLQPALRLKEEEGSRGVPTLIEHYLSAVGIGLHLRGDEVLPRREIFPQIMSLGSFDQPSEISARASVRRGNLASLVVKALLDLPVERRSSRPVIDRWAERARRLYSSADPFPSVRWTALANEAFLDHWLGKSRQAISVLDHLLKREIPSNDLVEIEIKRAIVLQQLGEGERAVEALDLLPPEVDDDRVRALRKQLGGDDVEP